MNDPAQTIALVGIGNPLAGDDGVGPELLRRMQERWSQEERLVFMHLESDLFALAEHIGSAGRFIFLDAVAGDPPGEIRVSSHYHRGFSPSFHQTDLASVMAALKALKLAEPFPAWEVWGITIKAPDEYRVGLSTPVISAAERLCHSLNVRLELLLKNPDTFSPLSCPSAETEPIH